jgi:energy-coupling factor transporter ATP-binding protein EcfA2
LAATRGLLLRGFRIDPSRGGDRVARLPFLSRCAVEVHLQGPLTFLVGENGSGKTTLLEAIAARCAIRPSAGRSYAETGDERDETALSAAVEVTFSGRRPKGLFLRADRLAEAVARAGRIPLEHRLLEEVGGTCGVSCVTRRDICAVFCPMSDADIAEHCPPHLHVENEEVPWEARRSRSSLMLSTPV